MILQKKPLAIVKLFAGVPILDAKVGQSSMPIDIRKESLIWHRQRKTVYDLVMRYIEANSIFRFLFFIIVYLLSNSFAHAAILEGKLPIHRLRPDVDAYPQNFAVEIDKQQRLFLGGSDAVLVYDGENWQKVPAGNGDIVRSLKYDGTSRVYVGGYDEFGYIEQNATGCFDYRSLTSLFSKVLGNELFADIWKIETDSHAVYFVGLEHLFRYEPASGDVKLWRHEGSFGPIGVLQGQIYLQFRGQGLKTYSDGAWHLVPGIDLAKPLLSGLTELDNKLIISGDEGWYEFDGDSFKSLFDISKMPFARLITDVIALDGKTLAFSTQLGKIVIGDLSGQHFRVVDVSHGFIPALIKTESGEIVSVDDLGLNIFQWQGRWSLVGKKSSLAGSVYKAMEINSALYVLTSSGAFVLESQNNQFIRLPWTEDEAWDLVPLPNGHFLLADSYKIKVISPENKISIIDNNTTARHFFPSTYRPDLIYVATEFGVEIIQRDNGIWHVVYKNDDMSNLRVTQIIEISPTELWLGSERGGIQVLKRNNVQTWEFDIRKLGIKEGVDYGDVSKGAYLYKIDNEIIATTSKGIFLWQGERFEKSNFNGLADLYSSNLPLQFAHDGEQVWAFHFNHIYKRSSSDEGFQWHEESVPSISQGAISAIDFVDNKVVVGNLGSLLVLTDSKPKKRESTAELFLSTITVTDSANDSITKYLDLENVKISSADLRLQIRYTQPSFLNLNEINYRTRLLPEEDKFSAWSEENHQSFLSLSPGNYELMVEARDRQGKISSLSVLIEVEPMWYETLAFRVFVISIAALLLYYLSTLALRRRSLLLARERDRLELMVSERTRELKSANSQLEIMAHLDGLTQIPNRRRLDTYLEDVRQQCVDRARLMAVAIIDVDLFKQYNDSFGHQAGDELLVSLAKLLSKNLRRAEDLVARYGGEEFIVVLPGADEPTAYRVIEEMRQKVSDSELDITISAGLHATLPDSTSSSKAIIETADVALYRAKSLGRNRVEIG